MKFLSLYSKCATRGTSVVIDNTIGNRPMWFKSAGNSNMNIITIVFKVGLIDFSTLFYELY